MYILPQILNISSENSLINSLIDKIKEKLAICIEKFIFSNIKNIYVNLTVSLQELFNDLSSDLIKEFIEAVDLEFKNSVKFYNKELWIAAHHHKLEFQMMIHDIIDTILFYILYIDA